MKILFDQGTPVPLRRHLSAHVIDTAYERGWAALANGDLIAAAEQEGYGLLITTDQNLRGLIRKLLFRDEFPERDIAGSPGNPPG